MCVGGIEHYQRADDEFSRAVRERVHVSLLQGVSQVAGTCARARPWEIASQRHACGDIDC